MKNYFLINSILKENEIKLEAKKSLLKKAKNYMIFGGLGIPSLAGLTVSTGAYLKSKKKSKNPPKPVKPSKA